MDEKKLDELMHQIEDALGEKRILSNQEMAEAILDAGRKNDEEHSPASGKEEEKTHDIPSNEDIAEEILSEARGMEVNEIPPDKNISEVLAKEDEKTGASENEKKRGLARVAEKLKMDKRSVKILIILAAVILVLCIAITAVSMALCSQISEKDSEIARKTKEITQLNTTISQKEDEIEKWKEKAEKYKGYIVKKKKKVASQKSKDKKQALANAKKIAIYETGTKGYLTKSAGAIYYLGHKETYYSSRVLYHRETGKWHTDSSGVYHDEDGYICVASNTGDLSSGQLVMTSRGIAKVHDSGCSKGTIDLYVNW